MTVLRILAGCALVLAALGAGVITYAWLLLRCLFPRGRG